METIPSVFWEAKPIEMRTPFSEHDGKQHACTECAKVGEWQYGYGPDYHCSRACHNKAMRAHTIARCTPEEREFLLKDFKNAIRL